MASMDDINMTGEIELPGFRFHPTEQELLDFYLKNMVFGKKLRFDIIGFLNIYHHEPWDLPGMAKVGEREWYFFVPRDKKHGTGGRPNRTTEKGFWKATGSDRKIFSLSGPKSIMGLRKTLVFYEGRAPRGRKTDWVMNEYRLPDTPTCSLPKPKDIVLCKIYRKATSLKVLEQRAAIEEEMKQLGGYPSSPLSSTVTMSICSQQEEQTAPLPLLQHVVLKKEIEEMTSVSVSVSVSQEESSSRSQMAMPIKDNKTTCSTSLQLPFGRDKLPELQVPMMITDWTQDSFWAQLNSPWLQNLVSYSNILNF